MLRAERGSNFTLGLLGATSALALLAGASGAAAQDTQNVSGTSVPPASAHSGPPTPITSSNAGAPALAEVVVTAQRRTERLQDVPVAVSVVSGSVLDQQNLTSLDAVAARLPDVKITSGPLVDQINIRGVGSGENLGFEQSVATFVDDVYRPRSRSSQIALFDIDQVEVLKGPQTTFFGANAIAGALNIETRKPGNTFSYDLSALGETGDGGYDIHGGITLPINDTLSVRLAAQVAGENGYVKNDITGGEGPNNLIEQGRISIKWTPTSYFRSDLRFDIAHNRTRDAFPDVLQNCPTAAPIVETPEETCSRYLAAGGKATGSLDYHDVAPPTFANLNFQETAWTNSLQVVPGTLTSVTSYQNQDYNNSIQPIPFPLVGAVGGTQGLPAYIGEHFNQFSEELRFVSRSFRYFDYLGGFYYSNAAESAFNDVGFFFLPFGAFNPLGTTTPTTPIVGRPSLAEDDRTLSGFAAATIKPFDGFRINLGVRYSNIFKSATRDVSFGTGVLPSSYQRLPDPATQVVFSEILGADLGQFPQPRITNQKYQPAVGLQYDLRRNLMTYFTFSQGFKAGGFSAASLANEFKPENVNAYEVGFKGEFLQRRLVLDADVFRSDYSNLQESTIVIATSGTILSLVQNAAQSRSQGVEVSGSYRLMPNVTVSSDLAYLDARYTNYPNGACTILGNYENPNCSQNLSGKHRPFAPNNSGNISLDAILPLRDGYELRFDPTVYFSSSFFLNATADALLSQSGYIKEDARLGFGPHDRSWEVAIIGKNLGDKITTGYEQQVTLSESYYALPDPPRTIAFQVSFRH